MSALGKKLLLKPGMKVALVGEPADQRPLYQGLELTTSGKADVVVAYAPTAKELSALLPRARKQLAPDARLWVAYPKAKKLGTDLNRDVLWKSMEPHGLEGVRLVSLDDTWSAMMFRTR
ncbi:MAG TPA: hypothetical protein VG496_04445 [Myxococcales bacterium]|nr:hypothetical protein [Myxococcales bacterium]